jgi:two-component system sensor histidine kinase/response regulator
MKKKILIIEDEQDIRQDLLKVLEYEGYEAIGAENGRVGVTLAKKHQPDLIICDIMMPELSGYGVLIELRRSPRTAAIPFIFLTARTARHDVQKGIQLGADAYLAKPFQIDVLLAAVATTLLQQDTDVSKHLETLRFNLAQTLPSGLQAPLTGILGFSGLLAQVGFEMLPEPGEIVQMQTAIYENALRLQRLIGNYLLYDELQLAEYDVERRERWQQRVPVLPKEIITAMAARKGQEFNRQTDVMLELVDAEIQASGEGLQKIAEELLDNALKFSETGMPVRVTTTLEGTRFTLRITDQGRGMTAEQIGNPGVPQPFENQQDEPPRLRLGLILARGLTQLCGGELAITSALNQGTTVTVVFNQNP